ncbi:MADS-box transcription factor 26-like [Lolium rigidum]|uniref:MADS-box transcription factor 26-like n=1 Tax=Lolium rigidum TaxID=89674 RepID=UPI001F5C7274|nr:MADS-box transcription factor 26-like [Lolium rigidum]
MARGKVQMRRIENPVHRQVTFCKRRMGLLKKAKELSVLCDADIGVMVFSPDGKIYELATNGNMQGLIERYKGSNTEAQSESSKQKNPQIIQQEVLLLRQEIDLLQKGLRYMYGAKDMDHMNLHELQVLESNLEIWVHNIRSTKMEIISREIEMLKNKEGILKATNDLLQERVIEQSGILDTGSNMMISHFPFQGTMESGHYF